MGSWESSPLQIIAECVTTVHEPLGQRLQLPQRFQLQCPPYMIHLWGHSLCVSASQTLFFIWRVRQSLCWSYRTGVEVFICNKDGKGLGLKQTQKRPQHRFPTCSLTGRIEVCWVACASISRYWSEILALLSFFWKDKKFELTVSCEIQVFTQIPALLSLWDPIQSKYISTWLQAQYTLCQTLKCTKEREIKFIFFSVGFLEHFSM